MTETKVDYKEYQKTVEEVKDIKQARVRQGIAWVTHLILPLPPAVSLYYASKTQYWVPFWAATAAAVVSAPIAFFDMGLTFFVAPPVTSAVLLTNKSTEKRRKLGIIAPEQADAMAWDKGIS